MQTPTTIYLVRHGQSEASLTNVYGTDTSITAKGIAQAEVAAKHFANLKLDAIIASPLHRAQQTAAIIARPHHLEIQTNPAIGEPLHGSLEGIERKAARASYPEEFGVRESLTDEQRLDFKLVEDMETDRQARDRFMVALHELAGQNPGKTLLVISHVPLMKLLLIKLGYATRTQLAGESIANAGVIKLEYDKDELRVIETLGVSVQN